ncbi:MAG: hypothetical protein WC350_03490 [Candidatus Micrarchaeia archaeon]|jgi:hypothetical protein
MDIRKIFKASKMFIVLGIIILLVVPIFDLDETGIFGLHRSEIATIPIILFMIMLMWTGYNATNKYGMNISEAGIISAFTGAVTGAIVSLVMMLLIVTSSSPQEMNESLLLLLIFDAIIILGAAFIGYINGMLGSSIAKGVRPRT